jgi:hypothetical protein
MTFKLPFGELLDESFERAGIDPSSLTARHLISARRSLGLLLIDIENKGAKPEYRMQTETVGLAAGQAWVILPADTIDVLDVAARSSDMSGKPYDLMLNRSSRQDWLQIADKATPGIVNSYWVSKSTELPPVANQSLGWGQGQYGLNGSGGAPGGVVDRDILVLTPPSQMPGTLVINYLRSTALPSMLDDDVDARRNWYETICCGLAAKVAEKFAPDREDKLMAKYNGELAMRLQSENGGDLHIGYRAHGFSRRSRH